VRQNRKEVYDMRRPVFLSTLALVAALAAAPVLAQAQSAAGASPAVSPPQTDTVLATVNGKPIHMSDVQAAGADLPANLQQLPPDQLFPLLVNQLIDRQALLVAATNEHLSRDVKVHAAMEDAANEKLENAYVQEKVGPAVTDAAVQAAFQKQYAGKPGPEQVDARHILVKTQAQAQSIIDQLNKGADFATLATKYSIDPGAKNGGELGWFSQDEMVPAFAQAAFALTPGQYTKTPVQTQFGWHVILCEGKRQAPSPSFDSVKDQLRQQLADNAIKATLADVRAKVKIKLFNPDGTPADTSATAAPGSSDDSSQPNVNLAPPPSGN
jgi:peptidyl-prolyl cis-trans isomerase C